MEEKKLRSATDNPLVVPVEDDNQTVTQANPHGASVGPRLILRAATTLLAATVTTA